MQINPNTPTQKSKRQRHEFLLTFFEKPDKFEFKEVNGYILQKYFSNSSHQWEVLIYTKESFERAQEYLKKVKTY